MVMMSSFEGPLSPDKTDKDMQTTSVGSGIDRETADREVEAEKSKETQSEDEKDSDLHRDVEKEKGQKDDKEEEEESLDDSLSIQSDEPSSFSDESIPEENYEADDTSYASATINMLLASPPFVDFLFSETTHQQMKVGGSPLIAELQRLTRMPLIENGDMTSLRHLVDYPSYADDDRAHVRDFFFDLCTEMESELIGMPTTSWQDLLGIHLSHYVTCSSCPIEPLIERQPEPELKITLPRPGRPCMLQEIMEKSIFPKSDDHWETGTCKGCASRPLEREIWVDSLGKVLVVDILRTNGIHRVRDDEPPVTIPLTFDFFECTFRLTSAVVFLCDNKTTPSNRKLDAHKYGHYISLSSPEHDGVFFLKDTVKAPKQNDKLLREDEAAELLKKSSLVLYTRHNAINDQVASFFSWAICRQHCRPFLRRIQMPHWQKCDILL